jgi:dephospho-CoA kinase
VILVGLTGGIGAGKSTVSSLLAARGAVIVDADQITRDLQQPGSPVLAAIAERFGASVLQADGSLDRAALAALVFGDADALAALNGIVHPAVGIEMNRRIDAEVDGDRVVVLDIPLLAENPRQGLAATIVVDVPIEVAVDRLVRFRSMTEADARARIERQASREARLALATRVVDNTGGHDALATQVDELWAWLLALPPTSADDLARYRAPRPKPPTPTPTPV